MMLKGLFEDDNSADILFARHGRQLADIIEAHSPDGYRKLREAHEELEGGKGYAIVPDTGINQLPPNQAELAAIAISCVFGEPTQTDRRKLKIAWPIRHDPTAKGIVTFSQTMGEAAFHTDTQYYEHPERYFGLFCMTADEQGKGTNRLVDGSRILAELTRQRPDMLPILQQDFPFRVPTVFTSDGESVEITWAPILSSDGSLRYRLDTLREAIGLPQVEIESEKIKAIEAFEECLGQIQPIEHHLRPGEALFANNHRLLHSRTPFENPNRLLYRVRMGPK